MVEAFSSAGFRRKTGIHSFYVSLGSCKVLLAVLCLCQLAHALAAEEVQVLFGRLQVVLIHAKEGSTDHYQWQLNHAEAEQQHLHFQQYLLLLPQGEAKRLLFPKTPKQMPRTGAYVMVRVAPPSRCSDMQQQAGSGAADAATSGSSSGSNSSSSGVVCVASMMAQEAAPRDVFGPTQPRGQYKFRALIMQLQVCGRGPATTPDQLEAALFNGLPNSQSQTVQGAFAACSYGMADFSKDPGGVQVVAMTVPIPCQGTTPWNLPYDSRTCPYPEWSDVANAYVKSMGIQWDSFKHKIYVVPAGDLCSWGGMGYVGCTSDCRAWISGDLWQFPTTWLHELGHNLYMNHAGSYQPDGTGSLQFVNYKDDSGAMGHCCSTRCFNAPHSYQVGWSKPVDVLHKDNLPAGVWRTYVLPPRQGATSSDINMLRVLGDWNGPSAAYNIFIEYRKPEGYDVGLLDTVKDKVTIYSTPLGDSMPFTTLEAAVDQNQILRETRLGSGLTIWVGSRTEGGIRVHLCRPETAVETECNDGKDNDCDGYTDGEDTDCKAGPSTAQPTRKLLRELLLLPRNGTEQLQTMLSSSLPFSVPSPAPTGVVGP